MVGNEPEQQHEYVRDDEEPDFADEHTSSTYENEPGDPSGAEDESVPDGPAGEGQRDDTKPL